jgi:hypothetical protein
MKDGVEVDQARDPADHDRDRFGSLDAYRASVLATMLEFLLSHAEGGRCDECDPAAVCSGLPIVRRAALMLLRRAYRPEVNPS